jgi:hypothetical protein
MGARGLNVAEEAHVVSILSPGSLSGGETSTYFNLKTAYKANIIVQLGALAAAPGALTLLAAADNTGTGATAIPFTYYTKSTAGDSNDTLDLNVGASPAFAATAAGFVPANAANSFAILVVNADQLPSGLPYVALAFADGTNVDFVSAVAILTGLSYPGPQQPSATL